MAREDTHEVDCGNPSLKNIDKMRCLRFVLQNVVRVEYMDDALAACDEKPDRLIE
jgi:hypothetical protein